MNTAPTPTIFFDSEDTAKTLVAGLPCAVRALQRLERDAEGGALADAVIVTPHAWSDPAPLEAQIRRLFPTARVTLRPLDQERDVDGIDGVDCVVAAEPPATAPMADMLAPATEPHDTKRQLRKASRAIVAATGKPTDGFVSRALNRPISQFVTYHLLRVPGSRPIHATFAAGLIGIAMALCLFFGGSIGLIAGAVLFQLASIIDGVDGEMARATSRSSKLGATLDTATDTATNFAFFAGIIANVWIGGDGLTGQIGLAAMGVLALGLGLLGLVSWRRSGMLSFDTLKHDSRTQGSATMSVLAKLLSRDVYVLLLSVLVVLGLASAAIMLFAGVVALWFLAVIFMLATGRSGDAD